MIIDEQAVITGAFNFTRSAEEKKAENLLIIRGAPLAARYLENWRGHADHSEVYARKHAAAGLASGGQEVMTANGFQGKVFNLMENQLGKIRRAP